MIEVEDLLAKMKILEQSWATRTLLQAVLVVGDRVTLSGGESSNIAVGYLMRLATVGLIFALGKADRSVGGYR